jgi:hypothetical protein
MKTIFCDIDGTLLLHHGDLNAQYTEKASILEGTVEKIKEWDKKKYNIILVTGRRESMRNKTEHQLESLGIFYDKLIMGIGGGPRIMINDLKPNSEEPTAIAVNIKRNKGVKNVKV